MLRIIGSSLASGMATRWFFALPKAWNRLLFSVCEYNELTTRDYLPNILPHPDTIANGLRLVEPSVMPRNR